MLLLVVGSACATNAQQPNIVLFLVDDMGWQDTSVEFHSSRTVWNDLYNTPNMERLAAQGMKFTNAYAASPVCSPTRTSLMTGQNPARSRISDWIGHGISQNSVLRSPDWNTVGLQPRDGNATLPTILSNAGYRTAHVGKAHFGAAGTSGSDPTTLGFEINRGGSQIGTPDGQGSGGRYFGPFPASTMPNLGAYGEGDYITTALTAEANAVIDQAVDDQVPFFINMAHYAIHAPIGGQGDPTIVGDYQSIGRPNPEDDYAAMIASMDKSLGDILDNLEAEGVADNTLVLFMSDNGGLSYSSRNTSGVQTVETLAGENVSVDYSANNHNRPVRSGKGTAYEGGTRVPMIVAWAGQQAGAEPLHASLPIAPGSTSDTPVISDDFFPTLLSVAGVPNSQQYVVDNLGNRLIDGNDLTPLLSGAETFEREGEIVFHYPHQWTSFSTPAGVEPFTAIRKGDYRLTYFYGDGQLDGQGPDPRLELYDLTNDLGETTNLAETHPNTLRDLCNAMVAYLDEVDAQLPIVRATGELAELPSVIHHVLGDLNNDDQITIDDWLLFRPAMNQSIIASNRIEAEDQGDLNFDLVIDRYDFLLFKSAYNEANGANAFAADSARVPEPSTAVLFTLGTAGIACWTHRRSSGSELATPTVSRSKPALSVSPTSPW
ncbi:sulfatase-like hydrolase/transferase [Aeoliella mucimassa]|nr:sulfatase-like hydrolase/transferase [Aeoliella mucimassa]